MTLPEDGGPKNYYVIRLEMIHVRKGKLRFNEKTRARISYINTEGTVRQLWTKFEQTIDSMGNSVQFRKPSR